ncbi:MAG: AGE family epimerase/isomerase [Candidatus Hydrogenedentes bacterium]|nr:AGE family epimerase/isomerase [Candidatus Hydrogenedentota bacterium]
MPSLNKPQALRLEGHLIALQDFLRDELAPFYLAEIPDSESGGYRVLQKSEESSEQDEKVVLIEHVDTFRACAELYRNGIGGDAMLELARNGMEYLLDRFCDSVHGGWFRTLEQDGTPADSSKCLYGHARVLQALSEYAMASGDPRAPEWAVSTFQTCQTFAADNRSGGYYEHFARDWSPAPEEHGPARKSFRSHTNFLYALTSQYEATGASIYARKSAELLQLISARFLHPEHGTGIPWCAPDWSPMEGAIEEGVRSDDAREGCAPVEADETHYGWNMAFAATVAHSRKLLEEEMFPEIPLLRSLYVNTLLWGVDLEKGRVFRAGPQGRPVVESAYAGQDEHWATLTGLLDAFALYEDPRYLDAYESVFSSIGPGIVEGASTQPSSVRWLLRLEEQLLKITL